MDRVERTQTGSAGRPGDPGKVRIQFDERQEREDLLWVGLGVCPRDSLHHLDDRDSARYEVAAPCEILEGSRLGLGYDELGDRRGIEIETAQRGSLRRSASNASVAVVPVVTGIGRGSFDVSGFVAGETRPSAMRRSKVA